MIIFLYGEDTYRSRQKLNEIIEHYKKIHKSGLNLKYFNCQKESGKTIFADFRDLVRQTSMFKEKKLVIVNGPFSDFGFKEKFLIARKDFVSSQDIILFYEQGKVNGKDKLFIFLKKNAECQEFKPLEGQKLKNWIKKELKTYNTEAEPVVIKKLVEYIGNDLWRMSQEIKKLVSFKKNRKIKLEDVELLVKPKIETDIFKTIDAIAQRNKKQALKLLHRHLEKGNSPLYILSMISFQFRNLLIVKELIEKGNAYNVIFKKSGLHPFVVKKSYFQSQQFTFSELKKIYQKIFQVDLDIKTGHIKPEVALDMFIVEI